MRRLIVGLAVASGLLLAPARGFGGAVGQPGQNQSRPDEHDHDHTGDCDQCCASQKSGEIVGTLHFCDGNGTATVYVNGVNVEAVHTGPAGTFHFSGVPEGTYSLEVDRPGQAPFFIPNVQVQAGHVTQLGTSSFCPDNDHDGYDASTDCNDNDPAVHPGAAEVCGDGIDNNCDGHVDEGCQTCTDADEDGFFAQSGCGTAVDCNDGNGAIHPGATETCNNADDNCDGRVDEGFDLSSDPNNCGTCGFSCGPGGTCVQGSCVSSADADGDGFTVAQGDCNDHDPSIHPGANDPCDGIDNNCNGVVDENAQCDDGNFCTTDACTAGSCQHLAANDGAICSDGGGVCANGSCTGP